jgi:RNA polymerase sigma-70 factor (ECF subfamily)
MSSPPSSTLKLAPLAAAPAADRRLRGLVDEHFTFVARVVRNLGVAEADLDDVLQRAFCAVARRLDDIAPGSERAFLVQAAINWAHNARRARSRNPEVGLAELPDVADASPSPEDLTDRKRAAAVLDGLLATMDLELRTVLVLYEIEEMSRAEIAQLLGLPQGTVASRLRRAREDFESKLARWRRGAGEQGGGR